jgi:uncharacterized protein
VVNHPERTCIGCRGRDAKSKLIRLVRKTASIAVDLNQSEPGRGAYLHRKPECLDQAVRRRALGRALRAGAIDGDEFARVVGPFVEGPPVDVYGRPT